jgi:nucleotide-binding universal stress UspA family protein
VKSVSRVLVAVDFSKPARGAFDHALAISQRHGAELVALQAIPAGQPYSWHARARIALTARFRRKAALAQVVLIERTQQGDPAEIILLHARSLRPDLIVLGTHQRRGFDRLRRGSVAERVAARAMAPVLLVPPSEPRAIRRFSHIAVAVDFGHGTDAAIELATLAADSAGTITLIHVVPPSSSHVPAHLHGYGIPESGTPSVRDAHARLQVLAERLSRRTTATVVTRILAGDPSKEIDREVDSIAADVLVVGSSTRGLVSRALFGTTATRLLRSSRIPLLAVPRAVAATARDERAVLPLAA